MNDELEQYLLENDKQIDITYPEQFENIKILI